MRALAVGVVVPVAAGYLLKKFVLDPRAERQRQQYGAARAAGIALRD